MDGAWDQSERDAARSAAMAAATPLAPEAPRLTVAYWGHDRRDSTLRKRLRMLRDAGLPALALTFDRGEGPGESLAARRDVDLGRTADAAHGQRVMALIRAVGAATRILGETERQEKPAAEGGPDEIFIARNLDMLLLAIASAALRPRRRRRIVYECLDIHRALSAKGAKAALLRWVERRALARTTRIAVSSEAFISEFFAPRQGWRGPVTLLENRLYAPDAEFERPTRPMASEAGPLIVVCAGMLRCQVTLDIFKAAAAAMGDRVLFRLHGKVQDHAIQDFDAQIAPYPNIVYAGPYRFPEGLAEVYGGAHLVWAQDLWRRGGNSDWLIPNRLYEGGFHGVPAVAVAGSETARVTERRDWGYVLENAEPETAIALFERFCAPEARAALLAHQGRLLACPRSDFETTPDRAMAEMRDLAAPDMH